MTTSTIERMEVSSEQEPSHARIGGLSSFEASFGVAWLIVRVADGISLTVVSSVYAVGGSQTSSEQSHGAVVTMTTKLTSNGVNML